MTGSRVRWVDPGQPGSTQKKGLDCDLCFQVVLSMPFFSKLNNEEINFTFLPPILISLSFPLPLFF